MVKNLRRHTSAYKLRIALQAVEGGKTISQLSWERTFASNLRPYTACIRKAIR